MRLHVSLASAALLALVPAAAAFPQEGAAQKPEAPKTEATRAEEGAAEFKMTFSAVTATEFPFETKSEGGGGGCAPPKRNDLKNKGMVPCIPLVAGEFTVEPAAIKIFVDTNGDGKTDKEIKGTAGNATLQVTYASGIKSSYAVRLYGNGAGTWTYERWCWMSGRVQGIPIALIDENGNGSYDEKGIDRIVVGDGTYAMPLSEVIVLGDKVLKLEVDPSGTLVRTRPFTGECGTVDLTEKFRSKGKLTSAVLKNGSVYIEVARKGGVRVPAGSYELYSGVVSATPQVAHLKKGRMDPIEVTAGKTTVVEWGTPVAIDFAFSYQDSTVTIKPEAIKVLGKSGEEYFAFKPMAFTPTIVVRDARNNAVVQKGTMCLG